MDKLYDNSETGCCPRFDPKPCDEKAVTWKDKLFLQDRVRSIFRIPVNFGPIMIKSMGKIERAKALADTPLMLVDDNSLWGSDIYIAVGREVPYSKMTKISGTFLTKVFEGPFSSISKWLKEMKEFVKSRGREPKKMYLSYTTCPKCAKYYGKNYVVIFAQI